MPEVTPAVSDAAIAAFIARWSAAHSAERPVSSATLAQQFTSAKEAKVQQILETPAALGRAHPGDTKGTFVR